MSEILSEERRNADLIATYAGTAGPWTAQVAETMILLGADRRIGHDQGETFPEWIWRYETDQFDVDVLGYLETNDDQWHYVLQAAGPRKQPDEPYRHWIVPAINIVGDTDQVYATAADLLNYALARTNGAPAT